MKITRQDRELAYQIAGLFEEEDDYRTVAALSVILWSHRQQPADEKENDRDQAPR